MKIAKIALIVALIALSIAIGERLKPSELDHVYPRVGYVIEIDEDEGWMIVRDMAGLEWKADAVDFWYEYVAMLMHDNSTPDWIYDDIILAIR